MGANVLRLQTNPAVLIPNPNPLVALVQLRMNEGADSHGTVMLGNLRPDKALAKILPFGIFHGPKEPIYNLRLARPETLAPWLDSLNVNFLGIPLPLIYPAGVQKFGLPSLDGIANIELPTLGLPSIPFPNIQLPGFGFLQMFLDLIAFFVRIGVAVGAIVYVFLAAVLHELIEKIKLALPTLSLTMPIEWLVNLLFKLPILQIPTILGSLMAIPPIAWPAIALLPFPTLQFGPLPEIPGVDMDALRALLDTLIGAFQLPDGTPDITALEVFLRWLSGLGTQLAGILAAMLAFLDIHISFSFPGLDLGQVPPPGTPWPAPFFPSAFVPLVSWPSWMRAPIISNVPMSLPPGTGMAAALPGTFAYTSLPGFYYQAFIDVKTKSGLAPGMYTQELYLEGTPNPAGTPLLKVGKILLVAQVLEPNLAPGFRPFGMVSYGVGADTPGPSAPLMDRTEQYMAAPQKDFESEHTTHLTYVTGQSIYPLPDTASHLSALQVTGDEQTDADRATEGFEDTVDAKGNGLHYLVRLYEDPDAPGTWLEEALIPEDTYTVELVEDIFDTDAQRNLHRLKITWTMPDPPPEEVHDWPQPIGTPAAYIPLADLPAATPPTESPAGPPVAVGGKYRLYAHGIANVTGAVLTAGGTALDVSAATPTPQPGPMIAHYLVRDGQVMDKS